ncbi:MAG: hypothetical protein GWN62_21980, partial [Aliifodinibius sp.]|nr:hypothetical protein [Fodinibius sp.]
MFKELVYKLAIIFLVGALNLAVSDPAAHAEILPVPYEIQSDANWCGVASLAMMVNYYGIRPPQHKWHIAKRLNLPNGQGIHPDLNNLRTILEILYPSFSDNAEIRPWGLDMYPIYEVFIAYLRNQIDNGNPVFLDLNCIRHAVVLVGMDFNSENIRESILYVNDPSGYLFQHLNIPASGPYIKTPLTCEQLSSLYHCYVPPQLYPIHTIVFNNLDPFPPAGLLDFGTDYVVMQKPRTLPHSGCYLDKGIKWATINPDGSHGDSTGIFDPEDKLSFLCYISNATGYEQYYNVAVKIRELFTVPPYEKVILEVEQLNIRDKEWELVSAGISLTEFLPSTEGKWYDLVTILKDSEGIVIDTFDQWLAFQIRGEPPKIVDGDIIPNLCDCSQTLTLQYTIESPFSIDVDAWLGATIRKHEDHNTYFSDVSHDLPVTLQPGTNQRSREFVVPREAPYGVYDVGFGIHSGKDVSEGMMFDVLWKNGILTLSDDDIDGPTSDNPSPNGSSWPPGGM